MTREPRPAGKWEPSELGVHRVAGGGLTLPYIRRPHDELLRAVLWLGELRRHVDGDDGPTMLRCVADLLDTEGHLIIATVWPQDWDTYVAAAGSGLSRYRK